MTSYPLLDPKLLNPNILESRPLFQRQGNPLDGAYQAIIKQGSAQFTAGLDEDPLRLVTSVGVGSDIDKLKWRRAPDGGAVFWEHKTGTPIGTAYTETGYSRTNGSGSWFIRLIFGG